MERTYQYTVKKLVPCDLCEGTGQRAIEGRSIRCAKCSGKGEYIKTIGEKPVPPYKKGTWTV